MDEKLFELMSKMYSDISIKLDTLNSKLDSKADKNDIIHIENKIDDNSKALFDGYKQVYEKLESLDSKVLDMSAQFEKQEFEVKVLKGGKAQ